MAGFEDDTETVSTQAAADAAQVIRGKGWLQRVVELAESTEPRTSTSAAQSAAQSATEHDRCAS